MNLKAQIRQEIRPKVIVDKALKENAIVVKIAESLSVPKTIGIYYPINHEPQISKILNLLYKCKFALPKMGRDQMHFCEYAFRDNLQIGDFLFLEPINSNIVVPDVVIVPGIAFDQRGYRLGYGKGCYDKYFAALDKEVFKIGVCFHENLVPSLPNEEHDVKMDCVITDKIIIC